MNRTGLGDRSRSNRRERYMSYVALPRAAAVILSPPPSDLSWLLHGFLEEKERNLRAFFLNKVLIAC